MASVQAPERPTVPQLMRTIARLSPGQLRTFKRRFAQWQQNHPHNNEEEASLIEVCRARLPASHERRLRKLIVKSERGELGRAEVDQYRALMRQAERLDATRLAALSQLARRWDMPVHAVVAAIGWEGGEDETQGRSARPSKARSHSRS